MIKDVNAILRSRGAASSLWHPHLCKVPTWVPSSLMLNFELLSTVKTSFERGRVSVKRFGEYFTLKYCPRMLGGYIWATNLFFCLIFRTVLSFFSFSSYFARFSLFSLFPHISHGPHSLFFRAKSDAFKKVLVLHAEKGLVRAGTPDLTLFHQATKTKIKDVTIAVTVVTIAIINVTIVIDVTFCDILSNSCSGLLCLLLGCWARPPTPFSPSSG